MGIFSPNSAKQKQIELQNIIFDTNEKKLMVSTEFLEEMTNSYISKRIKNINKMNTGMIVTKTPRHFFAYVESLEHDLNELIALEKYHTFKEPVPSAFKKIVGSRMERYIEAMINRTWKDANQRNGHSPDQKRDPALYGPVLDEILKYKDKYTPAMLDLIDKFYISVYDVSFRRSEADEEETSLPDDALSMPEEESDAETDGISDDSIDIEDNDSGLPEL